MRTDPLSGNGAVTAIRPPWWYAAPIVGGLARTVFMLTIIATSTEMCRAAIVLPSCIWRALSLTSFDSRTTLF